jgi:cyclopropane-fatty-acyl-phospholipid synthase
VGNDFYRLFLDDRLVYSCGYFPTGAEDIHAAQRAKLDHLCRKLRLDAGDRLLDVGCGWGGLVRHAASQYGAVTHGITLSTEQAALACERAAAEGLADRCHVEIRDYRALTAGSSYDKIVSVGMFEHVGRDQQPTYFSRMFALTKPGGLFLNHGIVERGRAGRGFAARMGARLWREGEFIDRYVFPDGELVTLEEVIGAAERAGFETRDVESLREHYALTLRHWVSRLEAAQAMAMQLVGEATYRVWRLYMSASAYAFESGRLNLAQVLFAKPDAGGRVPLPRTRGDLYA